MKSFQQFVTEVKFTDNKPYDRSHGSAWDRGAADKYYKRKKNPHTMFKNEHLPINKKDDPEEWEAYHAGYAGKKRPVE